MAEPKKLKLYETPGPSYSGLAPKPDFCFSGCPRAYASSGFVADWCGPTPRLAIMMSQPGKDDVTDRMPMSSGYGRFFWATIAKELGLRKNDLILSHVLRCYNQEYPTSADKKAAEHFCRNWDRFHVDRGLPVEGNSIVSWNPNIFMITFGLKEMIETDAFFSLALQDFRKALRFADAGYRPVMLLGPEAMLVVAPWLQGSGGVKAWRGHWWEGTWKWNSTDQSTYSAPPRPGFVPAKELGYKRPRPGAVKKTKKKEPEVAQPTLF